MNKIAIYGIKGSFHHFSIIKLFGNNNYEIIECKNFNHLTQSVTNKEANLGIIAIENTIINSILPNYIILINNNFRILNSVVLFIEQNLIGFIEQNLIGFIEQNLIGFIDKNLNKIVSHSIALQQCIDFISKHTSIRIIEYSNTAISALYIYKNILKKKAAIASKLAAKKFKLKIICKNIQSISNNFTKFFIVELLQKKNKKNFNKSSIFFYLDINCYNKLLNAIAKKKILITKIVSFNISYNKYKLYIDLIFNDHMSYEYFKSKIKNQSYTFFIIGEYINIIIL